MKITTGTVVFITGGASGLGEETARLLYNIGAKVCVADMQEDRMICLPSSLAKSSSFGSNVMSQKKNKLKQP